MKSYTVTDLTESGVIKDLLEKILPKSNFPCDEYGDSFSQVLEEIFLNEVGGISFLVVKEFSKQCKETYKDHLEEDLILTEEKLQRYLEDFIEDSRKIIKSEDEKDWGSFEVYLNQYETEFGN